MNEHIPSSLCPLVVDLHVTTLDTQEPFSEESFPVVRFRRGRVGPRIFSRDRHSRSI